MRLTRFQPCVSLDQILLKVARVISSTDCLLTSGVWCGSTFVFEWILQRYSGLAQGTLGRAPGGELATLKRLERDSQTPKVVNGTSAQREERSHDKN
jgi:hypothetical protein